MFLSMENLWNTSYPSGRFYWTQSLMTRARGGRRSKLEVKNRGYEAGAVKGATGKAEGLGEEKDYKGAGEREGGKERKKTPKTLQTTKMTKTAKMKRTRG